MQNPQEIHNLFDPPRDEPPKPHRGGLILLLGICGFFTAGILGAFAWYMGSQDLRQMNVGLMDSSGSDKTLYGRILGIVSVALAILALVIILFVGLGEYFPLE